MKAGAKGEERKKAADFREESGLESWHPGGEELPAKKTGTDGRTDSSKASRLFFLIIRLACGLFLRWSILIIVP
jgi:hypothetical protein